jgi:hypothetical protein
MKRRDRIKLKLNKKTSIILIVVVFAASVSITSFSPAATAATPATEGERNPNCDRFDYNAECDFSPTLHLLIGEVFIAGGISLALAVLFYHLTDRNQAKIEQIIENEHVMKNRRKDYAVNHLKNLLTLVIFTISMLRGSLNRYNNAIKIQDDDDKKLWQRSTNLSKVRADEAKLGRVLQSVRSILVAANDVLEPEIVDRIEGVCNYIGELSTEENQDGSMEFPKMNVSKIKVQYLLDLLKTYSVTLRSFKDIDEHYQSLAAVTQQLRVRDQEVRP